MDKFIESLTNHNLSYASIFNNLELHFLDLGAAISLDSYLFPLLLLNGDKFFIDGRTEAELLKNPSSKFWKLWNPI